MVEVPERFRTPTRVVEPEFGDGLEDVELVVLVADGEEEGTVDERREGCPRPSCGAGVGATRGMRGAGPSGGGGMSSMFSPGGG